MLIYMAYLSSAFDTTYNMKNLPPRQVRMDPRPDSTKTNEQSAPFKPKSNYTFPDKIPTATGYSMIQNGSKLGALRPEDMRNINNKNLAPNPKMGNDSRILTNYLSRPAPVQEKVVAKKNQIRSTLRNFDDWLLLGAIIISVGLFMRYKDKLA